MTKSLSATLKAIGFEPLSRTVQWCRAGELIHAVVVGKDRQGDTAISPIVWHSSLLADGEKFTPSSIQSPISGNVSPLGIDSSWTWNSEAIDPEFVASVLEPFFCRFATLEDVRRALGESFVSPFFRERLARGIPRPEIDALPTSNARYLVEGGATAKSVAHARGRAFLMEIMGPLGFSLVGSEDVVAIRPRGEVHDCVRFFIDAFGTFGALTCFPWTTAVWKVDKRWKGTYYPMIRHDVCEVGRPMLFELARLEGVKRIPLRLQVEERLGDLLSVSSVQEFTAQLDPKWATVATALRRL